MNCICKEYKHYIIGIVLCISLGMLSGYVSNSGESEWYKTLIKPDFNPPSWVFSPVWTILYAMMGVGLGIMMKDLAIYRNLLFIFIIQMIFNLSWSPLFFLMQRIDLALINIILLEITIVIFLVKAWHHKKLVLLFIPYFLWVSFALIINLKLYTLNIPDGYNMLERLFV